MPETIDKSVLLVSPSVKVTDTQDGVVLLDIEQGLCFPLDQVGTLIWKRLEQGSQVAEISQHIAETFHISLEQAFGDVQEFVQQLQLQHLLRETQGAKEPLRPQWIAALGALCRRITQYRHNHRA
jgi:hypothetical protein